MSDTPRLHKLAEVAEKTGIPLKTLQKGCRAEPPVFTHVNLLGGRRFMTDEHIAELIERHTLDAESAPAVDPELADDFARVARMAAATT